MERDEAKAKEAESSKTTRARAMESEWRYDRLKASSLANSRLTGDNEQVHAASSSETGVSKNSIAPAPQPSREDSEASNPSGYPLGGTKRQLKPWYEYEEYVLPKSGSLARDVRREDPLTVMKELEHQSRPRSANQQRFSKYEPRLDPLNEVSPKLKLREERLRRERQERDRLAKLDGRRTYGEVRGRATRSGPLRGED